jgi:hypothetical protein
MLNMGLVSLFVEVKFSWSQSCQLCFSDISCSLLKHSKRVVRFFIFLKNTKFLFNIFFHSSIFFFFLFHKYLIELQNCIYKSFLIFRRLFFNSFGFMKFYIFVVLTRAPIHSTRQWIRFLRALEIIECCWMLLYWFDLQLIDTCHVKLLERTNKCVCFGVA